MVDISSKRRFY